MHPGLAAIGFGVGCTVLALGRWRVRTDAGVDQGPFAAALVLVVGIVLLVAEQLAPMALFPLIALPWLGRAGGGLTPRARIWSVDAYVAAFTATLVVAATLPDTEGPVVLGAALVPMVVAAVVSPAVWRGGSSIMAAVALVAGVVVIAADAAADRRGALVVTLAAAAVCSALAIVGERLLLGDRRSIDRSRPITNGPGRPSR